MSPERCVVGKLHSFKLLVELFCPEKAQLSELSKDILSGTLSQSVAEQMDGYGYDSEPLCTNMQNVSVITVNCPEGDVDVGTVINEYLPEDVSLGFTFLVRITGHDYPARMRTMERRLTAIRDTTERALRELSPPIDADTFMPYDRVITPALVAVMFVPIGNRHLVLSRT